MPEGVKPQADLSNMEGSMKSQEEQDADVYVNDLIERASQSA